MDEEKLICLVQKYSEIYDVSDKAYHNQQQKDNIWEEIAGEMNRPVAECKKRWSTLRDAYRKSLKSQRTKSGDSAKKKKMWRYDKQMAFLRTFFVDRTQISNVEQSGSSEDETQEQEEESHVTGDVCSPNTIPKDPFTSRPDSSASNTSQMSAQKISYIKQKKTTLSSAEVLQDYLKGKSNQKRSTQETKNPSDAITKFFDCMAETVKTLSPQLQIDVKSQVFSIVTDAELKNLNVSPISQTTSQKETFIANQPSQSTNFHQENWSAPPKPHFQQQQQHQFPYSQPQTQHSRAIPPKPYSQSQSFLSFPSAPLPSTRFTENTADSDDNDLTQI